MKSDKSIDPVIRWFPHEYEPEEIEFEWDYILEELDQLIDEVNQDGYWYCTVENFGWQNLSGHAYLEFESARDMLLKVLPKCECSFNIYRDGKVLRIQNYHHDSPTGEWYELTPITEKEFDEKSL
ncbi:hypothetical protein STSP2_01400 [Anaerohalosphaera lusitana]|uniref:Uncharacterized protein n=1 Tax=Anaerohalosphaera lusitana TaxID=1936003 RepID=A0A1U9NKI3_9BACT|nr:hypothetical protein [Anaerohalosphaera lusitana]AQT68244.1 hypothetical protein STSP2_01400 [Anaerohalosphaera lusitana]